MAVFTVFNTTAPCNKQWNGSTFKHSAPIDTAVAVNHEVTDLDALRSILADVSERVDQCIMPCGYFEQYPVGQPFNLMSAATMRQRHGITDPTGVQRIGTHEYISRLNDNVSAGSIMLWDYDPAADMPDAFRNLTAEQLVAFVRGVFGSEIGFVATTSTSARVGSSDVSGYHLYCFVRDPSDLKRFKQSWIDQGFLQGWSYMKITSAGVGRPATVFDPSVFANRGRIDFAGKPFSPEGGPFVAPAVIKLFPGGECDTTVIQSVPMHMLSDQLTVAGLTRTSAGYTCETGLTLDMTVETRDGHISIAEFWRSDAEKIRCQMPPSLRDSQSWNGILRKTTEGMPMLYDNGTNVSYFLGREELASLVFQSVTAAPVAPVAPVTPVTPVTPADPLDPLLTPLVGADAATRKNLAIGALKLIATFDAYDQDIAYSRLAAIMDWNKVQLRKMIKSVASAPVSNTVSAASVVKACSGNIPAGLEHDALRLMNEQYGLVQMGKDIFVVTRNQQQEFSFLSVRSFMLKLKGAFVNVPDTNGETASVALSEYWLSSPVVTYEAVGMYPRDTDCPQGVLNTWTGFPDHDTTGSCDTFLDHLLNNICDGDVEGFRWLLSWMAHMVQRPWEVPGTAVILYSGTTGTGKSLVLSYLCKMLRHLGVVVAKGEQITGQFNKLMMGKLFVGGNEVVFQGNKEANEVLKSIITDETIVATYKGVDSIEMPNYLRFMLCTNHSAAVSFTHDKDRRFTCFDVRDKRLDWEYSTRLFGELDDGGPGALFDFLQSYEISTNVRECYANESRERMMRANLDSDTPAGWLLDKMEMGEMDGDGITAATGGVSRFALMAVAHGTDGGLAFHMPSLYAWYKDENKHVRYMSAQLFSRQIKMYYGGQTEQKKTNGVNVKVLNVGSIEAMKAHARV